MLTVLIIFGSILLTLTFVFVIIYNLLIYHRNRVDNAWHQIDVQLKRRYNLIPMLVDLVKGYASYEKSVFDRAAQLRNLASRLSTVSGQAQTFTESSNIMYSLFAIAENYPDLKAMPEFLDLEKQLSETEDIISAARKYYNGCVMFYDNARQRFPANLVASLFKNRFGDRDYFEFDSSTNISPSNPGT